MHDHDAGGHAHDHTAGANAKMLSWALALTIAYLVAEVKGVAVGIGLWVRPRTWVLLRDMTNVLLECIPDGTKLPERRAGIAGLPDFISRHICGWKTGS